MEQKLLNDAWKLNYIVKEEEEAAEALKIGSNFKYQEILKKIDINKLSDPAKLNYEPEDIDDAVKNFK